MSKVLPLVCSLSLIACAYDWDSAEDAAVVETADSTLNSTIQSSTPGDAALDRSMNDPRSVDLDAGQSGPQNVDDVVPNVQRVDGGTDATLPDAAPTPPDATVTKPDAQITIVNGCPSTHQCSTAEGIITLYPTDWSNTTFCVTLDFIAKPPSCSTTDDCRKMLFSKGACEDSELGKVCHQTCP